MTKLSENVATSLATTPDIEKLMERCQRGDLSGHYYVTLLGLRTFDTVSLLARLTKGLSYSALERFARNAALPRDALCELLQIPPRTLARRKEEGRLNADESDRLLRAARILASSIILFEGDAAAAQQWLTSPQLALGNTTPLTASTTELGVREVERLIGRLEHGIPS